MNAPLFRGVAFGLAITFGFVVLVLLLVRAV